MKRVVIIGGGIAGLAAAYALKENAGSGAVDVALFEKQPRLGGNIKTENIDGFIVEAGPDCFLSEKPWAMGLCKRLGLGERLLPTNDAHRKTYVLSGKRLHELPEGVILMIPTKILPLLLSPLISMRGKLRMALEPFIPRKKDKGDETLGDFVRRRLGAEVLDKIAEPLVAGVHAGDPDTMSIRSAFPKFVELEENYGSLILGMVKRMRGSKAAGLGRANAGITMFMTLKGGLRELVDELERRLTGFDDKNTHVRTGVEVSGISRSGGIYKVMLSTGDVINADAVIIAAPAYVASSLLAGLDAGLSKKLLEIPYASTATVSVAFRKADVRRPMDGFGFVVPMSEKRRIMASTWSSVKFKYRAPDDFVLMRCFLGGAKNPEMLSLSEDELIGIVLKELKDIMGIDAVPALTRAYKWPRSMPQYTVGHEQRVGQIEQRVSEAHPGLFLAGSAYRGIGISDNIRNAEDAARQALKFIGS